jgi:hypothetical protein
VGWLRGKERESSCERGWGRGGGAPASCPAPAEHRTCRRGHSCAREGGEEQGLAGAHSLVETPSLVEGEPQQAHVLQHDVGGAHGAGEDGRVHAVEREAAIAQQGGGMVSFGNALLCEVAVHPSCEAVLRRGVLVGRYEKQRQRKRTGSRFNYSARTSAFHWLSPWRSKTRVYGIFEFDQRGDAQ